MYKIWVLWLIVIHRNPFWKNIFWKCIKRALLTSVSRGFVLYSKCLALLSYLCLFFMKQCKKRAILILKTSRFAGLSSNIARGDISRAGIIFLQCLQLRALLECGFYSREGLIWGNTVGCKGKPTWTRHPAAPLSTMGNSCKPMVTLIIIEIGVERFKLGRKIRLQLAQTIQQQHTKINLLIHSTL